MNQVCITNDVKDLRPCTIPGQHQSWCDGIARRWQVDGSLSLLDKDRRWRLVPAPWTGNDPNLILADEGGKLVVLGRACTGCMPRPAEHGLLCWSCWQKTRDSLGMAVDMITHLASVDRAQQVDNAGRRGSETWVLPVPATWRLADEMLMLLGHPTPGLPTDAGVWEVEAIVERIFDALTPDVWVASQNGAEAAVRFHLAMQHAMHTHPMEEYEHRVRNVRCPACRQRTLLWKPPIDFIPTDENPDGRVRVVCTNHQCELEMDQRAYEKVAVIEETIRKQAHQQDDDAVAKPRPPRPDDVEPVCKLHADGPFRIVDKRIPTAEVCVVCGADTTSGKYRVKEEHMRIEVWRVDPDFRIAVGDTWPGFLQTEQRFPVSGTGWQLWGTVRDSTALDARILDGMPLTSPVTTAEALAILLVADPTLAGPITLEDAREFVLDVERYEGPSLVGTRWETGAAGAVHARRWRIAKAAASEEKAG